jgi:hypothetical protein
MDIQHQLLASVPRWLHAKSSKRISHFVWQTQNLSFCDKRNNYSKQQKNQRIYLRSTRSRKYLLGSGLPGAFSQQWRHSAAAAAAATQEHLKKWEGDEEVTMSLTHLDSTLACIVSSTTLDSPARNAALLLRCPRGRPLHVHVLSRGRQLSKAGVSAMAKQRGGRKMFTLLTPRSMWPFDTCLAAPYRCLHRPRYRLIGGLRKRGISLAQAGPH